jgi:ribosomal protein S12 methylthiotransferase accessory factor
MEGIELHYGETYDPGESSGCSVADGVEADDGGVVVATFNELAADGLVCPLENLPFTRHNLFHPGQPEEWVIGFDLIGQRPLAVPFACVGMLPSSRWPNPRFNFQGGSNGLASGNTFLEAVCSGLAEVIERDAVTCAKLARGGALGNGPAADLDTVDFDSVADLREQLCEAGMLPLVFDCTGDTGVPAYAAYLFDERLPSTGIFPGYGAHLHPEVALLRALTEAVQGRGVYIAGSRDDFLTLEHRRLRELGERREFGVTAMREDEPIRVTSSLAGESFEDDCRSLMDRVRAVGLEHVVVVDLAPGDIGLSVVRVVVPGLEGYSPLGYWTPGPRGRAVMSARASDGPVTACA